MNYRISWRFIPIFLFIAIAFFLSQGLFRDPHHLASMQIGKSLPAFVLPVLEQGSEQSLTPEMMRGHFVLLNVWASWCGACTEEQVFLMQLARSGVPIYGLNYKDDAHDATTWLATWGNPYRAVGWDGNGHVAMDLGVYGAPETFLIDPKGMIQYRHVGPLTEQVWRQFFLPRMLPDERAV
jgi:cytochrome c biogenesis protein CcmG/thiol:disulfide interchange protein DsbE